MERNDSAPIAFEEVEEGKHSPSRLIHKHRVEIFGRKYTLRSDNDEAYAKDLAAMVDSQMRKLVARTRGAEFSKLAIVTAINVAHELCLLRKQQERQDAVIRQKVNALIERLENQLAS